MAAHPQDGAERPRRVVMALAYVGQGFAGLQRQTSHRTIEGEVERALQVTGTWAHGGMVRVVLLHRA